MYLDRFTLIYFGALIVSVILHEISHGLVALWFGDDTAKKAGRLTLNPIPHIDPFGSIILPALGAIANVPTLAWAKPVPVRPDQLRHPRRDMLIVSLAGPATNLMLATLGAVTARILFHRGFAGDSLVVEIVFSFALVNVLLAVFNFLPIPPLDGAALVERLLPQTWLPRWYRIRQYGFIVLFVAVFTFRLGDRLFAPIIEHLRNFVVR